MQAGDSDEIFIYVDKTGGIKRAVIQHNTVTFEFKRWYDLTFGNLFIYAQD